MQDHTNLLVWQRSHRLTLVLYQGTGPRTARRAPAVVAQLRRSVASIPANIAEGAAQLTPTQFAKHLAIGIASASETENHLTLLRDLGVLARDFAEAAIAEVVEIRRMLIGLRKKVMTASRR